MPSSALSIITVAAGFALIGIVFWEIIKISSAKLRDYRSVLSS